MKKQFKNASLVSAINGSIVIKNYAGIEYTFTNASIVSINNGIIVIESKQNERKWKPKIGEIIYTIQGNGEILESYYDNSMMYYQKCIEIGNCFKTREEAEIKLNQIKNLFKE